MTWQPRCGPAEARNRAKVARMYLDVAELAADEPGDQARNVAAGNAVLAGIAASDAICCMRLGKRHRGQDHHGAVAVLLAVRPDGPKLAADLAAVLTVKDPSHYGEKFVGDAKLEATMRAAARLVEGCRDASRHRVTSAPLSHHPDFDTTPNLSSTSSVIGGCRTRADSLAAIGQDSVDYPV